MKSRLFSAPKAIILSILPAAAAILLSFTEFYGVAYLIVILLAAVNIRFLPSFSTLLSRFFIAILLLLATIMVVGLVSWFLRVPLYAPVITGIFLALTMLLGYRREQVAVRERIKIIDRGDVIGIIISLFLPVIVVFSYLVPYNHASLFQLLSNGWDNAAHIVMLETVSAEKGYVYGKLEDVQHKTINRTNAYPQAWHLATSHAANGFGTNVFDPAKPITVLQWYAVAMGAWFILGAFIVSKAVWTLTRKIRQKAIMPQWLFMGLFILLGIAFQLLASAGSMLNGFASYLGTLAYVPLLIAAIIDLNPRKPDRSLMVTMIIACTAGSLCWFLPFPALLISTLLVIAMTKGKESFSQFLATRKTVLITGILLSAVIVAQTILFIMFTEDTGAELLITAGGVYQVSEILIGALVLGAGAFLLKYHKGELFVKFIIALFPLIIFVFGVYMYQWVMSEELSYYYYKLTTLAGIILTIFIIPIIIVWFDGLYKKLDRSIPMTLIIFPAIMALALLISQQTLRPFHFIFQANSNFTYATAHAAADYLENEDAIEKDVIVLTDRSRGIPPKNEVYSGDLISLVSHKPYTCLHDIYNKSKDHRVAEAVKRLGKCADEINTEIVVITNDATRPFVEALEKPNIRIVNVGI